MAGVALTALIGLTATQHKSWRCRRQAQVVHELTETRIMVKILSSCTCRMLPKNLIGPILMPYSDAGL